MMKTYFAPAERASDDALKIDIDIVANHTLVNGLLQAVCGLLAVLNEQRQIVSLNTTLLKMLDIENPEQVLGFRPGEAIGCVHARENSGGCGTAEACASCGAVIAIVTSQAENKAAENICAAKVRKNGVESDLFLRVQAVPMDLSGRRFLLLFLQDITRQQQLAALERVFFHDVSNLVTGLAGTNALLVKETQGFAQELAVEARQLTRHLVREVQCQKHLVQSELWAHPLELSPVSASQVFGEIQRLFRHHPAAKGKVLRCVESGAPAELATDIFLVSRVLSNLVTNALEATPPGGEVRLWAQDSPEAVSFCVWNEQAIPETVALRVFQRNFTTKDGAGRGLGTFSTKLFGEQILKGKVQFTSSPDEGTVFELRLPK